MTDAIPHTYEEAANLFKRARYPDRGKPINHSCRIMRHERTNDTPTYALKLHNTDIVTWYANGDVDLWHDGWTTPTTKEKMNEALIGLRADGSSSWWSSPPYVDGRMESGWTRECIRSERESYFSITANNGSYIIPNAGITLDMDGNVLHPEELETLEHWLLMEAEEDRVRRRQRSEEKTQEEMERFLNSPYACVFTPHKKPLAVVFPRESDAFVPSLVLVDENHRSQLKYEVLAQALENGNRLDIVKTDVIAEAVGYIQTN